MPFVRESGFGQFLCCVSRMKNTEVDRSAGGHGIFPFDEGKTVATPSNMDLSTSFISASKSGSKLAVLGTNKVVVLDCLLDLDCSRDSCAVSREIEIPSRSLLPHLQILERSSGDSFSLVVFDSSSAWYIDSPAFTPRRVPIPQDQGELTCACPISARLSGSPVVATGTTAGRIFLWSTDGTITGTIRTSGRVVSLCSDYYYLYAGTGSRVEIYSLMSLDLSRIDSIELPDEPFGSIGASMLRPMARVGERRPSSPLLSPEKGLRPVGSLFVVNEKENCLAHINLDLRQVVTEMVSPSMLIEQLVFGPFDNGPVLSASESGLAAWESGAFLRISSKAKTAVSCVTVSPSREKPRLWTLSRSGITSFGLRSSSRSDHRMGCL
jgi:hypothetical protein